MTHQPHSSWTTTTYSITQHSAMHATHLQQQLGVVIQACHRHRGCGHLQRLLPRLSNVKQQQPAHGGRAAQQASNEQRALALATAAAARLCRQAEMDGRRIQTAA